MSETREKGDKDRSFDEKKVQRLQQLQEKQKLTNEETAEAKKLTADLTGKYGDLGIVFDEIAGKIDGAADAMQRFMDAANANASQELEAELKEARENIDEINKEGAKIDSGLEGWSGFGYMATGGMLRNAAHDVGLGFNTVEEQKNKEQEAWFEKKKDALQKEQEIRKKIAAIKGGENAIDVAKGEEALLDERLAGGQGISDERRRELEDAEKGIARIQRDRSREQRTALENEIADLKDRNEEYKKFLKLLIETEQAKPEESQNKENIANWQKELGGSDSALQRDINRIRDKNKIDTEKFASMPMTMEISAKRAALNDAVAGGDTGCVLKLWWQ
jgi:DNA repair exonuclease SbcCD ATPase subunit